MALPTIKPPSTFIASRAPITDKNGMATWSFINILTGWDTKLSNGLSTLGQLQGEISALTKISGRTEGIGITVGNVDDTGVMNPPGLVAATDIAQGAVVLPAGATTNVLGTASTQDATTFDAAGSAAAAQNAAETHADAAAATAQSNAQAFASNASNISSGNLDLSRLPSTGLDATITTAALTVGGTQGSMTFQNGLLTAQVPAT